MLQTYNPARWPIALFNAETIHFRRPEGRVCRNTSYGYETEIERRTTCKWCLAKIRPIGPPIYPQTLFYFGRKAEWRTIPEKVDRLSVEERHSLWESGTGNGPRTENIIRQEYKRLEFTVSLPEMDWSIYAFSDIDDNAYDYLAEQFEKMRWEQERARKGVPPLCVGP